MLPVTSLHSLLGQLIDLVFTSLPLSQTLRLVHIYWLVQACNHSFLPVSTFSMLGLRMKHQVGNLRHLFFLVTYLENMGCDDVATMLDMKMALRSVLVCLWCDAGALQILNYNTRLLRPYLEDAHSLVQKKLWTNIFPLSCHIFPPTLFTKLLI